MCGAASVLPVDECVAHTLVNIYSDRRRNWTIQGHGAKTGKSNDNVVCSGIMTTTRQFQPVPHIPALMHFAEPTCFQGMRKTEGVSRLPLSLIHI